MTDPRNRNLNSAFLPKWKERPELATVNPGASGDTQFDPLMGTGWDRWLDGIGAKLPGGARLAGGALPKDAGPVGQSPEVTLRLNQAIAGMQGGQPRDASEAAVLKRGKVTNDRAKSYLDSFGGL